MSPKKKRFWYLSCLFVILRVQQHEQALTLGLLQLEMVRLERENLGTCIHLELLFHNIEGSAEEGHASPSKTRKQNTSWK